MRGYTEALGALRQVVAKAGDDPSEVSLRSSRIGAAKHAGARGGDGAEDDPDVRRRWKSSETSKEHTRNNPEDANMVSL